MHLETTVKLAPEEQLTGFQALSKVNLEKYCSLCDINRSLNFKVATIDDLVPHSSTIRLPK